jgi:predicted DNA-binding transcriptional regulator AlpA
MKRKEDYPLVLSVKEIQEILGIGRRQAYDLMDQPGFPCIKLGPKTKRVNRDAFFDWMDKRSQAS